MLGKVLGFGGQAAGRTPGQPARTPALRYDY
jgi:hypothetical protein